MLENSQKPQHNSVSSAQEVHNLIKLETSQYYVQLQSFNDTAMKSIIKQIEMQKTKQKQKNISSRGTVYSFPPEPPLCYIIGGRSAVDHNRILDCVVGGQGSSYSVSFSSWLPMFFLFEGWRRPVTSG